MLKASLKDANFIEAVKAMDEGDKLLVQSGELTLEHKFNIPTHFTFHQRIFPAGVILKKTDSNTRIFIEAEKLGMTKGKLPKGKKFIDKQITADGTILPADPDTQFQPKK